jgi:rod shape-determining protein MreC
MWRSPGGDRTVSLFIGLIIVSLVLVTIDLRAAGEGVGGALRDSAQTVFTPVQRVFRAVTDPVVSFFEGAADLFSLRSENEELREQIAALEAEVEEAENLRNRIIELEEILGVSPPDELETVTAQVLAGAVTEFDYVRLIDKGRSDGITVDMPVIDEGGLVGRVISVTENSARVRLIVDPTFSVAVRAERTGETGIVTGRGSGPMILEMFNTDASLSEGDRLVTADGRFPAGISVAVVSEDAQAEVGFTLRTSARPSAEISSIDFIKVLVFTRDEGADEPVDETPVDVPVETEESTTTITEGS